MRRGKSSSSLAVALALALSGGTVFGGCQTRFKEIAVAGVQDYISILISPDNVLPILGLTDDETADD
ncbi:MAG: hypothetical protein JSU63_03450 [Phycisphaerales bacterium]|nr:MAG: hypothetical protein JSU63_03450 [Phycisphaerales bacterium]